MRTMKTRSGGGPLGVMTTVYQMHYRSLVRLAALLVSDLATAEDIVQDAFAAAHDMWDALPATDTDAALCYLRRSVVRRSRSAPRAQLTDVPFRTPPSCRRCGLFPFASARSWSCCISPTCPRPRSPRRPG